MQGASEGEGMVPSPLRFIHLREERIFLAAIEIHHAIGVVSRRKRARCQLEHRSLCLCSHPEVGKRCRCTQRKQGFYLAARQVGPPHAKALAQVDSPSGPAPCRPRIRRHAAHTGRG